MGNVLEYTADKYDPEAYSKRSGKLWILFVTEGEEWGCKRRNYSFDASDVRSDTF